jgi:hypothetical protein
MEAEGSSYASASAYKTIWCYIPECHNLNNHRRENTKTSIDLEFCDGVI